MLPVYQEIAYKVDIVLIKELHSLAHRNCYIKDEPNSFNKSLLKVLLSIQNVWRVLHLANLI
jgi:hypothetical protein